MNRDVDVDLSRYGLRPRPFQSGTDPQFLWLGRAHQEILGTLKSGVLEDEGVLLLTGEVGTGKTILAKALLESLGPEAITATVMYARVEPLEFLKEIGDAWGVDGPYASRDVFYGRLKPFLDDAVSRGKRVLLVVDEAQTLSRELFAEIGHLANIAGDAGHGKATLSILLVGQNELDAILSEPENAALKKRVSIRCTAAPLKDDEVREYVLHQLKVAGSERPVFTADGLREIAASSRGIPRLINMIGDLALLSGSRRNAPTIDAEIVEICARRLGRSPRTVDRARRRRDGARTRKASTRKRAPAGRAAAYVAVLALALTVAGYLYYAARRSDARQESRASVSSETLLPPARSAIVGASEAVEPARASEPDTGAMRIRRRPVERPSERLVQRPLERPADRLVEPPPEPPPAPAVTKPRPVAPTTPVPEQRREVAGAKARPASRDQEAGATPPASAARRPGEVRTGEGADAVDPAGIIDWLLSEYPARRQ